MKRPTSVEPNNDLEHNLGTAELNLCCLCRQKNQDEARDTFKMLKSQFLGENSAHLYATWATLEAASGQLLAQHTSTSIFLAL